MKISEDDKWYIADAASTALPALISQLEPPTSPGQETVVYAKHVTTMAHLIGLQMLVARENMLAAIAKNTKEKTNDDA